EQSPRTRKTTARKYQAVPRLEYFWLCDECSPFFTLTFASEQGLIACPLPPKPATRIDPATPYPGKPVLRLEAGDA
ncbi:MAG: hypothetical protein ACRD2S_02155, partial [Terriglobales bacterium]